MASENAMKPYQELAAAVILQAIRDFQSRREDPGEEKTAREEARDFLLGEGLARQIFLHLKPQPFFVSDAMRDDVVAGLEALKAGGGAAHELAQRLQTHQEDQRLALHTHWHYATNLFYFQLPDDLRAELAGMDLVILKGDVNYRRLVGDVHWPPTTPFEHATAYFPAPLVSLRTMKAELIVGLSPGHAERLHEQDPEWMVDGRRGLIQARLQ